MKVTSKQADATMAKLTSVMQRNTTLTTGKGSLPVSGPVNTYTPQPPSSRPQAPTPPTVVPKRSRVRSTSGIRFNANDLTRIRQIVQAGFDLQHQLTTSDAIRVALRAYDPKRLTAADIAQVHAEINRSGPQAVAQ